ncbi:hypothetical protein Cp1R7AA1_066 [Mesorhizobium phage Cp1R7A-A1]|nr:hypothetical protein Cp1R7AA1_066 [Mesorhizobium phage Cp1R7A-A1]
MPNDETHDISLRPLAERWDSGKRYGADAAEIGQWYWVKHTVRWDGEYTYTDDEGHSSKHKKGDVLEWFGCVMEIGSNYVEIQAPRDRQGSYSSVRIHFDEFEEMLRHEPDPNKVIAGKISTYQARVSALLGEVKEVTQRLGVVPTERIEDKTGEATNALVAVTSQVDTKAYKNALIEAKDKTLPDLFKEIETANSNLARWMMAPTMAVQASIGPMKKSIKVVEDRIYTLELYAGLTEDAVQVRQGDPAAREEKLRLMQRRLYMDEECLVNYEAGGMEMKHVEEFDAWLSRDDNFSRLLPFERCAVAFRVRRTEKEREGPTLWQSFINIYLANGDKTTFLYIRNGGQLWRINCDFDFGPKLVPDQTEFDPSQPMMVKMFASRIDELIPRSRWEVMRDAELENERKRVEWNEQNTDADRINNPFGWMGSSMRHKEYAPFDTSNVYYDQAMEMVSDGIKKYNRVAVIVQGLFDRSLVLHPHDPVRVWDPVSFANSIEVVYDATTLTYGEKPDFEAYRARLNASIDEDSIVTGQEDFWLRAEAVKENERQRRDYRNRNPSTYTRYRPYGNEGPGRLAKMAEWKPRANKAVFRWTRERKTIDVWNPRNRAPIDVSIAVPSSELLNVSAYKPGDFRQFFEDPRTRREYLKWAPLMLTAEDYYAGKELKKTQDVSWVSE